MRRSVLPCFLAGIGALACAGTAAAAEYVPGELIVRFKPGVSASERADARRDRGAKVDRALPLDGAQLLDLKPGQAVRRAATDFEDDPRVEYAEPNYIVRRRAWPTNDPFGGSLWGLYNDPADADIDAVEGWGVQPDSPTVTVAVVDTGVDLDHPDLQSQLDVVLESDYVDDDDVPDDAEGHGTHVAGTIGATGNNAVGITGVSQDVRLMPIRVLDRWGDGTLADVVAGFRRAGDAGAHVVNASLGGSGPFPNSVRDAIAAHQDVLFVVAAGNGDESGNPLNNDENPDWPCNYVPPPGKADNVVCVAASDSADVPASWSNYGPVNVDTAAPGVDILSSVMGGSYQSWSGTSMATPHVAGAAALVLAESQDLGAPLTVDALKERLLTTGDESACWTGLTVTGARLNLGRALGVAESSLGPGPTAASCPVNPTTQHAQLQAAQQSEPEPEPDPEPEPEPPPADAPPPAPAPPPATDPGGTDVSSLPATDDQAPAVRVSAARRYRVSTLLRRGLRSRVRCNEACRLRSDVLVGRRTAKKLGIRGRRFGRSYILVGRARATLTRAGTQTVTTRVTRRARPGLRKARSVRLVLRTVATDGSRNSSVTRRGVTVRR